MLIEVEIERPAPYKLVETSFQVTILKVSSRSVQADQRRVCQRALTCFCLEFSTITHYAATYGRDKAHFPNAPSAEPTRGKTGKIGRSIDKVTTYVHNKVMTKIGIAKLKAQLSKQLKKVRRGHSVIVLDRDTPIARMVPWDAAAPLELRRAPR